MLLQLHMLQFDDVELDLKELVYENPFIVEFIEDKITFKTSSYNVFGILVEMILFLYLMKLIMNTF